MYQIFISTFWWETNRFFNWRCVIFRAKCTLLREKLRSKCWLWFIACAKIELSQPFLCISTILIHLSKISEYLTTLTAASCRCSPCKEPAWRAQLWWSRRYWHSTVKIDNSHSPPCPANHLRGRARVGHLPIFSYPFFTWNYWVRIYLWPSNITDEGIMTSVILYSDNLQNNLCEITNTGIKFKLISKPNNNFILN